MSVVNGFQVGSDTLKYNYESLENYNTPEFSASSTYNVGDYVMHEGKLYRCTTEITTAAAWDSSKWTAAVLANDVRDNSADCDGLVDHLIEVTDVEPTSDYNQIWIPETLPSGVQVPTYTEFTALEDRVDDVEEAVASVETSTTASKAYAVGDYFWKDDVLYVVTAAIASGGTITVNTNCKAAVLGNDVSDLKSALSMIDGETRNIFDITKWRSPNSTMTVDGDVVKNLKTDSRSYLQFGVYLVSNNTIVQTIYNASETVRSRSFTFTASANADEIRISHGGSSLDLNIFFTVGIVSGKTYTLSLDILGANPTVVGGYSFNKIQLEEGSTKTEYIQHLTAVDLIARDILAEYTPLVDKLDQASNLIILDKITILANSVVTPSTISSSSSGKTLFVPVKANTKYALFRGKPDSYIFVVGLAKGTTLYSDVTQYKGIKGSGLYPQLGFNENPYIFTSTSNEYPYFAITYYSTGNDTYTEDEILNSIYLFEYAEIEYLVNIANTVNELSNPIEQLFSDEVSTTINSVKNKITSRALVLGITTDTHINNTYAKYYIRSTQNMKKVSDVINFDICANLGDIIDGGGTKDAEKDYLSLGIKQLLAVGGQKTIAIIGNHDNNGLNSSAILTVAELYAQTQQFNEPQVVRDGITSNFYIDYDFIKIRVICIDSSYNSLGFSNDTVTWLTSVLSSADEAYNFVILTHEPTRGSLISKVSADPTNGTEVETLLAQYSTRVLGYIHGHVHFDNVSYVNGFPEISITCGMPVKYSSANIPDGVTVPDRQQGGVTQDAWDVVIVLPDENKFEFVRFGAGEDRTIPFRQT